MVETGLHPDVDTPLRGDVETRLRRDVEMMRFAKSGMLVRVATYKDRGIDG